MALIHSAFFTCSSYLIKKRKKAATFKLIKLLKHTQKHAVTTKDRIIIRHYRLDKSIEPENMPPNNPGLNPADWKICHKDFINIKGLGMCNTRRIYWKNNGKNRLNTR